MDYRLTVFSSAGKPSKIEDWACASDNEAIERASRYVAPYGCELWQDDRHISTFAGPLSAPPAEGAEVSP
jgi:hypothetical protein